MNKFICSTFSTTALCAAIALAAPAANASVTTNVYSNITGLQLWVGTNDLMTAEAPGSYSGLAFSGSATDLNNDGHIDTSNLRLDGQVDFVANGLSIRLTLGLTDGDFAQRSGITFRGGNIQVDVQTTSGYFPYATIDASTTNLGFLASQPGHLASDVSGQTTAGITRNALPGLWDGVIGGTGFDRAVGVFTLLGQTVGFYMEGTIESYPILDTQPGEPGLLVFDAPEVPLPAAAWLFGSSLAGLAGVRGWRTRHA